MSLLTCSLGVQKFIHLSAGDRSSLIRKAIHGLMWFKNFVSFAAHLFIFYFIFELLASKMPFDVCETFKIWIVSALSVACISYFLPFYE